MIHLSALHILSELKGKNGDLVEFAIKYVAKSTGQIISGERCICTSSNFERRTRKIKFMESGETRTFINVLIIEFNGQPVFL
jgi:hypothetical protein